MFQYSGRLGVAQKPVDPAFDKVTREAASAHNTGNIASDVPKCADAALAALKANYAEQYNAWISAGSTDADILQSLATECERLYRAGEAPPKKKTNWLLWGGLGALAVAGVIVAASPKIKGNPTKTIAEVDFDEAEYIGDGTDGVYVQAVEYFGKKHANGWYVSGVVDSETGAFVHPLFTDDGPYSTYEEAMEAGRAAARDWCVENDVDYESEENPVYGRGNPVDRGRLTKSQVEAMWRNEVKPRVQAKHGRDRAALRQSWNDYTHMLRKDGLITADQYATWIAPRDAR